MKTLSKRIRLADAQPTLPENNSDSSIRDSIESLGDSEDVKAFVAALTEYNGRRADLYLAHVRSFYPTLWSEIKKAADEEEPADGDDTAEGEPMTPNTVDTSAPSDGAGEMPMPMGEGEDVTVPVVDPEQLDEAQAQVDMYLFNAETKDPHWTVFANGIPMAEIHLADQENADDVKELFTSPDYQEHVKEACASSIGVRALMESLKARYYHAVTKRAAINTTARTAATKQLETEYGSRLAALKEDLLNTINLAVVASLKGQKGLFIQNNLKVAMIDAMRRAGVQNAAQLTHDAFTKHGQEYFASVLKHAEKWLGYSPEALSELSTEILGPVTAESEPESAPLVEENDETPAQLDATKKTASVRPTNVPLRTVSTQPHSTDSDDYRQRVAGTLARRMGRSRAGVK